MHRHGTGHRFLLTAMLGLLCLAGRPSIGDDDPVSLLTPATQPEQPADSRPTDDSRAAEPALRVGAILPLTGVLAPYGQSARRGLELAAEHINANGGAGRGKVEVVFLDTQSQERNVATLAEAALRIHKAEALVGGISGPHAILLRGLADRRRRPCLVLAPGYRSTDDAPGYTLGVSVSDLQLADALARFAIDSLAAKSVYVLGEVEGDQPTLLADRFTEKFTAGGGELKAVESIGRDQDFAELAARVARARPDVVLADMKPARLGLLTDELRRLAPQLPVLASARFWSLPPLLEAKCGSVRPAYLVCEFAPDGDNDAAATFAANLAKRWPGATSDTVAVLAYDSLLLLAEAARSRTPDGTLAASLHKVRQIPGLLGPVGFDEKGQIVRPVTVAQLLAVSQGDDSTEQGSRLAPLKHIWPAAAQPPAAAPNQNPNNPAPATKPADDQAR